MLSMAMKRVSGAGSRPLQASVGGFARHVHVGQQCFPVDQPSQLFGSVPAHPQQATIAEMFDNPNLKKRAVPVQLRQSGDGSTGSMDDAAMDGKGLRLLVDTRVRKGPYFHLSQEQGCWAYQIYNNVYHPRAYVRPEDGGLWKEYEALTNDVTMWNVAVERQICVKGPDAEKFVDYVITRKASLCKPGFAKYVILCNQNGGILNDPIMLRPYKDEFWFSLSDSDISMYLQGVNHDHRWDVDIREIDVAPVQIQGPKAPQLMEKLVGPEIQNVPYYGLHYAEINGCKTVISRTGWSTEKGYEIYLYDATRDAEKMWYHVLKVGEEFGLRVIAPGHNRRIEAGILSYLGDMDIENNPYECGLGWQVDLKKDNFVGKEALAKIKEEGVKQKLVGLTINGGKKIDWYISDFYHVRNQNNELIGYCTSGWFSPEQNTNIALAMVPIEYADLDTELQVVLPDVYKDEKLGNKVPATVVQTPFKMPSKEEMGSGLRRTGSKL